MFLLNRSNVGKRVFAKGTFNANRIRAPDEKVTNSESSEASGKIN